MSSINKEILEERIRENALEFIELVPEAYNIAISYVQSKILLRKESGKHVSGIDEFEETCIDFIEKINKKIVP